MGVADRDRLATPAHRLRMITPITRPSDHERATGTRKARPTRRHGTGQPRRHTKITTQQHNSASDRARTNSHAKSRLVARGSTMPDGDHVGVCCVAQRDWCVVSGSGQVMARPVSSSTSAVVHRSLCPTTRFGQFPACLLTATTDFRADAAMNVMFCVPGTFLTAGLAYGYTRLYHRFGEVGVVTRLA